MVECVAVCMTRNCGVCWMVHVGRQMVAFAMWFILADQWWLVLHCACWQIIGWVCCIVHCGRSILQISICCIVHIGRSIFECAALCVFVVPCCTVALCMLADQWLSVCRTVCVGRLKPEWGKFLRMLALFVFWSTRMLALFVFRATRMLALFVFWSTRSSF